MKNSVRRTYILRSHQTDLVHTRRFPATESYYFPGRKRQRTLISISNGYLVVPCALVTWQRSFRNFNAPCPVSSEPSSMTYEHIHMKANEEDSFWCEEGWKIDTRQTIEAPFSNEMLLMSIFPWNFMYIQEFSLDLFQFLRSSFLKGSVFTIILISSQTRNCNQLRFYRTQLISILFYFCW